MKYAVTLLAATAAAVSLPAQNFEAGAQQDPPNTVSLGWGRDGNQDSETWSTGAGFSSSSPSFPSQGYNPYNSFQPPSSYQPYRPPYNPYSQPSYNSPPPPSYNAPPPSYNAPPPPPSYNAPPPAYNPPVPPPSADPSYGGPDPNTPLGPGQNPQQVTIEKTGYSGNGCPSGSVSTLISPDKTVVTFGFDSFQATIGPGTNPGNKQKNCQLHLGLRYPSGYQMSIMTATYHGYVRLDPGVTANFISSYYFSQAAEKTAMTRTTLQGPEYSNGKTYTKSDSIKNESMIWSPCGANGILNVNNRIALTSGNPQAAGEISNDDATLKFEQKLAIAWRSCPGGPRRVVDTGAMDSMNTVTDSTIQLN